MKQCNVYGGETHGIREYGKKQTTAYGQENLFWEIVFSVSG
jgi:hypothetical protein